MLHDKDPAAPEADEGATTAPQGEPPMITADLSGKRALVTGAASGIGLATAELFLRLGAAVALNDLPGNPALAREVGRLRGQGLKAIAAPGDVGDAEAAAAMVVKAAEDLGGLDFLVNNAGTPGTKTPIPPGDLDPLTEAFWRQLLSVNLLAAFRCTKAALPYLKAAKGAVVNTASVAGFQSGGGSSVAYAAAKAGLVKMTKDLARGLAPDVRVNAIAPGLLRSNWECRFPDEDSAHLSVPLLRLGEPADSAEVILFLCAGAAYVTGQTIRVDGGYK
jgi:3-oxoacyl-[acyl-carrier protein] reductase